MTMIYGDENSAYELLYGGIQDSAIDAVQSRISSLADSGIALSTSFIESTKHLFNRVASHDVVRQARRLVAGVQAYSAGNNITVLNTALDFQTAKAANRRWVAANPYFRELLGEQVISGYGENLKLNQPGYSGFDCRDYRLATNNMVMVDEENEKFHIARFDTEPRKDELMPSQSEQFDIQRNWTNFRRLHTKAAKEGGEDITDEFGELL